MCEGSDIHSRKADGDTAKQMTLVGLEAPRLKRMDVPSMSKFRRLRMEYVEQVKEKNREPGVQITAVSCKNSIPPSVQWML